jgi:hypothetical protein
MKRQVGLLTFSFLFVSVLSRAQSGCPQGFVYAGTLSGTGSVTEEFNKKVALRLPDGATLDESFQQARVRATNAKGKALRPQDIPKGILIIPNGGDDSEKVWSVSEPKLTEVKGGDNGISSTRYEFGMRLSCRVVPSPYSQQGGVCDVGVKVCYKPKSKN